MILVFEDFSKPHRTSVMNTQRFKCDLIVKITFKHKNYHHQKSCQLRVMCEQINTHQTICSLKSVNITFKHKTKNHVFFFLRGVIFDHLIVAKVNECCEYISSLHCVLAINIFKLANVNQCLESFIQQLRLKSYSQDDFITINIVKNCVQIIHFYWLLQILKSIRTKINVLLCRLESQKIQESIQYCNNIIF